MHFIWMMLQSIAKSRKKNAIENIKALKILFEIDDKKDFEATPSVQKEIAKDLKTLLNLIKQLQKENKKLREYYEEQNEVNAKFIAVQKVKDKIEEKIQEAEKDLQKAIELEKETKTKEDSILWWAAQIRLDEKIKVLKEILKEVKKDGNGDNV